MTKLCQPEDWMRPKAVLPQLRLKVELRAFLAIRTRQSKFTHRNTLNLSNQVNAAVMPQTRRARSAGALPNRWNDLPAPLCHDQHRDSSRGAQH